MMRPEERHLPADAYVGTIVGESTSTEFRLAVAHEAVREQDIIAVDGELRQPDKPEAVERIRIWAKVQRIERLNPLFPSEAGHELAATHTDPFDTVLSLSREMVTAVCTVLGSEIIADKPTGKLGQLRYPARPATRAYRPPAEDIKSVVLGELKEHDQRALDLATLANQDSIDVSVDGHAIVTRHLAILAMTGAGKSWASRRIIEQLAERHYPIIIFDPHGDYTGLSDVPQLKNKVRVFHAAIPLFEEDGDELIRIISGLAGEPLSSTQADVFESLYQDARQMLAANGDGISRLRDSLHSITSNDYIRRFPFQRDLFALSYLAQAASMAVRKDQEESRDALISLGFNSLRNADGNRSSTYNAIARQCRRAAFELRNMEQRNESRTGSSQPLPKDKRDVVDYDQISVVSLTGYSEDFRATLYAMIARRILNGRVQGEIPYPCLLVLEEAHNLSPGAGEHSTAIVRATSITKQIAQEGRKFGVGLVLISQRPSRIDETTLSQCNSFIVMRLVNPADQSYVRRVIESLGEDEVRLLPDLDAGEALLSGQMIRFPVLVKMKKPDSRGEREEDLDAFQALAKAHDVKTKGPRP